MYYRRKILLSLLETLNREVTKTILQKYLFLVSVKQKQPAYDFIPYRYGCFSFQADADKKTLTKYDLLKDQENWALGRKKYFTHLLKREDRDAICRVVDRVGNLSERKLIQHVYRRHPYYAINSEIRHEILSRYDQDRVESARPAASTSARLFTIGYQGQSLESYLNRLIEKNIVVLCDVRRNPVSMKFGFSKRQLQNVVQGLGITYVNIPELGIESSKRRELDSPEDYETLFKEYVETTLKKSRAALRQIMDMIKTHSRVALTCFEADHKFCHRGHIAEALSQFDDFRHRVAHL